MFSHQIFELALNIASPWYIEDIKFEASQKRLDIYIDFKRGSVFKSLKCENNKEYKVFSKKKKTYRHLNFFEHECYLHCKVPNLKLDNGKYELVKPPWAGVNSGFTLLFEALVLELCSNMPVKAVSRIIKETDKKIWRIIKKYVKQARELEDFSDVSTIGIDETSKRKGHKYISLFVDMLKKKVIYIAQGKDSKTVTDFVNDFKQKNGSPSNIKNISCDMSKAFIKGVKENFKEAKITFDKFHIIKIINEAIDKVRRQEIKEETILRGKRYLFLKNSNNLTANQKRELEKLKISKLNLKTLRALHIRENFQEIYKAENEAEFIYLLKKWYYWATHSRLAPIKKAAKTIKQHWDGIVAWKKSLINNGLLEGLNSVIQAAKNKARGYKNTDYLKNIAYLLTGKLKLDMINPNVKNL